MGNTGGRQSQEQEASERGVKKCVTVKNHASVRKETIKFVPINDDGGQNEHELQLTFDCNYDCQITVYLQAAEIRNSSTTPLFYYVDQQKLGRPQSFKFKAGLKQTFPKGASRFNLAQFQVNEVTAAREDFYPIVIAIESLFPTDYRGRAKKSVQFTCGTLSVEADNSYKFKLVKQKLLYNKTIFELTDMYGKDSGANGANGAGNEGESQRECVICFTVVKDTVVLPCRHLCLCQACSQIVRMQNNTCPICRTRIESFMHIKFKDEDGQQSATSAASDSQANSNARLNQLVPNDENV